MKDTSVATSNDSMNEIYNEYSDLSNTDSVKGVEHGDQDLYDISKLGGADNNSNSDGTVDHEYGTKKRKSNEKMKEDVEKVNKGVDTASYVDI